MSLGPVGIPREYQGLKGLENTLRWTSPSQEQSRLPGVQSWDRPPVQYQRWLEPLWLASESTVQCNSELPGPRLYQLRAEETRQKSNPESQITGKQGNWKIWDSHPSPGTCKGFLCAVWIQFLGQLPLSRDISKGQQEANHELSVGLRGTLQFQHTLGEKVEAWPGSVVECQQKECKIRSPRAHDQRQALNLL